MELDRWNAARVDGEIGRWRVSKRWNSPGDCATQFGVYRKAANPQDRSAWISDCLRIDAGEVWDRVTMWDYSGGFRW